MRGRIRSALIIGLQGIRARKTRTFLSMISLFLGVLAVVAVQAGAETAKTLRLADLELHAGKDGTRQMYLPPNGGVQEAAIKTLTPGSGGVGMMTSAVTIGEPGVAAVHDTNGRWDLLAEIRSSNLTELGQVLERLRLIKGIGATETSIHLMTYKVS